MSSWFRLSSRRRKAASRPTRPADRRPSTPDAATRLQVVVVGAGIAGLTTALLLGRRGHRVIVVEQEPIAAPAGLADARWWWRPSAPQTAHGHVFAARCRELLAAEAPDVLTELRRAGVVEPRLTDQVPDTLTGPVDDDPRLVGLAARRPVFEWVLRRALLAERGVTLLSGLSAVGLVVGKSHAPRVTAVRLAGGQFLPADLVVDAAGRRSPVPGWLLEAGGPATEIEETLGAVTTHTRIYEVREGRTAPPQVLGGLRDGYACRLIPADAGAFAITFEVPADDRAFDGLVDGRAFERAAAAMPEIEEWLDPSVSRRLTRVARLTSGDNRLQRLTRNGRPLVVGLLPVGDAVCATSPGHGRGVALALLSSVRLAQAVEAHPGKTAADATARTLAMDAAIAAEIAPWFRDSVVQDARIPSAAALPDLTDLTDLTTPPDSAPLTHAELALAAQRDPHVWSALARLRNLLVMPSAVLSDPETIARARAVLGSGWLPEPDGAPTRDELLAVITGDVVRELPRIPVQRLAASVV